MMFNLIKKISCYPNERNAWKLKSNGKANTRLFIATKKKYMYFIDFIILFVPKAAIIDGWPSHED
jgi:hypothetical protein